MSDQNANVVRVFGLFANLDTGAGSIIGQFVYATDTKQIGVHLSDDSMKWFSSDDSQVLLAGVQTITGAKTFSAAATFTSNINANASIVLQKLFSMAEDVQEYDAGIGGDLLLDPDETSNILVYMFGTSGGSYSTGIKAGTREGQLLFVQMQQSSSSMDLNFDDTVVGSADISFGSKYTALLLEDYETALFSWNDTDSEWMLYATTGTLSPEPGDVTGPSSVLDNAIARYNSTTGKIIQASTALINDDGDLILSGSLDLNYDILLNKRLDLNTGYADWATAQSSASSIVGYNKIIIDAQTNQNIFAFDLTNNQGFFVINEGVVTAYMGLNGAAGASVTLGAGKGFWYCHDTDLGDIYGGL